jgi:uncharacterized repeat protein (TIGR01451 family)
MGPWADGCQVTVLEGQVLVIEWQRGTDVWRATPLQPDDTYVIDLVAPEDNAMLETPDGVTAPFRVALANCTPQPLPPGSLTVSKTDGQSTATPGTAVTYTITVTNGGTSPVSSLTLTDPLPTALVAPVFTPSSGSYDPSTGSWTGLDLPAGGSVSMTLAATIAPGATGTLVNTATVLTDAPASATDTDALVPSANLGIVHAGPVSATAGADVSYTTTVTNLGPSDAQGVSVAITGPLGLVLVTNDCLGAAPCSVGTLAAGQSRTILSTYRLAAGYAGPTVASTAGVSAGTADPSGVNDAATASATVARSADVTISKTGPADVRAGQQVTFVITVRNDGPSDAEVVTVQDPTPPGLVFVSNTGACTTPFPCALGTLPAGSTRTISAAFSVPSGYAGP